MKNIFSLFIVAVMAVCMIMHINTTNVYVLAISPSYTIFINEVMAANTCTLRDGDTEDLNEGEEGGAYSDWIELYNPGENSVDLTGYTLSDDGTTWTFPEVVIPAKGHLLVWASDKDKVAADGQLHTNFKIS